MPRLLRIGRIVGLCLVVLVVLYTIAGFWVVPAVVASQVESVLAEQLELEGGVERVAFQPFALRLEVDGFRMGRPGEPPAASLEALLVDLSFLSLLTGGVVFEALQLASPRVEIQVDEDGRLFIAGVGVGGDEAEDVEETDEPEVEEDPEAPVSTLKIRSLVLSRGIVRVQDLSREPVLDRELGPIDLNADELDLTDLLRGADDPDDGSAAELVVNLGAGSRLSARGQVDVDPLRLDLTLGLEAFPLRQLQPYVARSARLVVRDGQLDLDGRLRIGASPEVPAGVHFEGTVGVASLAVSEPEVEEPMLAWESLAIEGIDYRSDPAAVRVAGVALARPDLVLVQTRSGLNLVQALEGEEAPAEEVPDGPSEEEAETAAPEVEIGPLRIEEGRVRFVDRTVSPAFAFDLASLGVDLDRFSLEPSSRSKLAVDGRVWGRAPLTLGGTLAPVAPREHLDLDFELKALDLARLAPYTLRHVGRPIESGLGAVNVGMNVAKHELDSSTRVVLNRLEFGERVESPDATTLPVAAAVSLLKDGDGRIQLDIPVQGDLDDPEFSYRGAVLDTLRNLITKVVATPFKLVDGMVSYGGKMFRPEEMGRIGFPPDEDELPREEALKLDALLDAFRANPELELEVEGGATADIDRPDRSLPDLARRRAEAVVAHLVAGGVSPERIYQGDPRIGPDALGEDGRAITRLDVR